MSIIIINNNNNYMHDVSYGCGRAFWPGLEDQKWGKTIYKF